LSIMRIPRPILWLSVALLTASWTWFSIAAIAITTQESIDAQ
jgi:hypothetical protein